jgi:hypothetical protein
VHNDIDSADRCGKGIGLGDIAERLLVRELEEGAAAGLPEERADLMSCLGERLRDVRAEEAARSGDENAHYNAFS